MPKRNYISMSTLIYRIPNICGEAGLNHARLIKNYCAPLSELPILATSCRHIPIAFSHSLLLSFGVIGSGGNGISGDNFSKEDARTHIA